MSSTNTSSASIMSATSSKKSATKTAAPAAVAVPVPTPAPAAKAAKAPKAVKAEAAPAPAAAVAAEPVAAEAEGATDGSVLLKNIEELSEQLSGLKATLQTALLGLKTLEKQAARVVKKADRRGRRKAEAVEGAPKKPCIFTQPVKISEELCSFLALSKGTEVSRSAVTKAVMAYARSHSLMDKQTIKADAPLRKLLSLKDSDPQLTILNLQTYLSRHYVKAVPVAK
jgi:predicted component of type VI protein secretion system